MQLSENRSNYAHFMASNSVRVKIAILIVPSSTVQTILQQL